MDGTKSLIELKEDISAGKITSAEATKNYLAKINATKEYNAVVEVFDDALEMARAADKKIASGFSGRLAGVPIIIKDNILYKGHKATACSKILQNYVSQYNATVVEKLLAEGAVIIGRANMDEFAMGSSTETSVYGVCHNPLDFSRVPGGSSGGSAASVKLGLCAAALGTDTGGSVRQPSSFCGLVGIKPTYGRISRYGVIAYASSLDQVGVITHNVADNAYLLGILAGADDNDMTCSSRPVDDYQRLIGKPIKGTKIGVISQVEDIAKGTPSGEVMAKTIQKLKNSGAEIVSVDIADMDMVLPTYYILATAEASSNLDRYDGVKYTSSVQAPNLDDLYKLTRKSGFGKEVQRRIMLGTFVLTSGYYDAYYKKAKNIAASLKNSFYAALDKCDCIIMPTTIGEAYKIGEKSNPVDSYKEDIYTVSANITGLPAISLPCGKGENGLPIGMQFIGSNFDEATLYKVASFIENSGIFKQD